MGETEMAVFFRLLLAHSQHFTVLYELGLGNSYKFRVKYLLSYVIQHMTKKEIRK